MSATIHPAARHGRRLPNLWDAAAILCVFAALIGVAHVARGTFVPIDAPEALAVSLDPAHLPDYAVRTTLRMFAALVASLLFTFTYATAAAKSRRAALILIPILDILQSVPILGFLTFTVVFFMSLFPGRVLGLELAAIFAIFTSQAWNMAFSLYQSLKTVPADLKEAADSFHLTRMAALLAAGGAVRHARPGLEHHDVDVRRLVLRRRVRGGVGRRQHLEAAGHRLLCRAGAGAARHPRGVSTPSSPMLLVILAYDQLLFRPLVAWSAKFRFETTAGATAADPWLLRLMRRTRLLSLTRRCGRRRCGRGSAGCAWRSRRRGAVPAGAAVAHGRCDLAGWCSPSCWSGRWAGSSASSPANCTWRDRARRPSLLGLFTLVRVVVLMALASLLWVPIGVWLGLRPVWARRAQPLAQFLAAFPANLLFPPFVLFIVYFRLNADIWLTPLMVLGTQWYILFNVVAGAAAFPGDLREAASNFRVGGWLWWRKVMIPGIFPYYVTGAITASGGSWNAAIVAEVASWGDTKLDGARAGRLYRRGDRTRRHGRAWCWAWW